LAGGAAAGEGGSGKDGGAAGHAGAAPDAQPAGEISHGAGELPARFAGGIWRGIPSGPAGVYPGISWGA